MYDAPEELLTYGLVGCRKAIPCNVGSNKIKYAFKVHVLRCPSLFRCSANITRNSVSQDSHEWYMKVVPQAAR